MYLQAYVHSGWAYLGDNLLDFQRSKSEIQRQKQKRRGRGEKKDQNKRCNSHFFSHFSLKLGKTDKLGEIGKRSEKWQKKVYPRKHTFSQKFAKNTSFSQILVLGDNYS